MKWCSGKLKRNVSLSEGRTVVGKWEEDVVWFGHISDHLPCGSSSNTPTSLADSSVSHFFPKVALRISLSSGQALSQLLYWYKGRDSSPGKTLNFVRLCFSLPYPHPVKWTLHKNKTEFTGKMEKYLFFVHLDLGLRVMAATTVHPLNWLLGTTSSHLVERVHFVFGRQMLRVESWARR